MNTQELDTNLRGGGMKAELQNDRPWPRLYFRAAPALRTSGPVSRVIWADPAFAKPSASARNILVPFAALRSSNDLTAGQGESRCRTVSIQQKSLRPEAVMG
jgi:hypothetical protein